MDKDWEDLMQQVKAYINKYSLNSEGTGFLEKDWFREIGFFKTTAESLEEFQKLMKG